MSYMCKLFLTVAELLPPRPPRVLRVPALSPGHKGANTVGKRHYGAASTDRDLAP